MAKPDGRIIMATDIACQVLIELLSCGEAGVTELADELGLAPSTVHAQLNTLKQNGFVTQNGTKYKLSFYFLDFTQKILSRFGNFDAVRSEIDRLAKESGEVAQFATNEDGRIIHVHKVRGDNAVKTGSFMGKREPLHSTGLGKAILSTMSDEEILQIVDEFGLPKKTEKTITTRKQLFEHLENVRSKGYAIDDEENVRGLRCIAIPVMASPQENLGAISITGPVSRMTDDRIQHKLVELLSNSVNLIELNYKFS